MIPDPTNMFAMAALVTRGVLGLVVLYMIWRLFRVSLVPATQLSLGTQAESLIGQLVKMAGSTSEVG